MGKDSKGIQAGRDINIGVSYSDVKAIVYDLFEQNFPKLVKEAERAAKRNVDEYVQILESNIKEKFDRVDLNKFKDPNVQFLLTNSVKTAARKGRNIDLNLLSETLITSIGRENTKMLDIVAEQAIDAIPKLTTSQINILSIVQYILYTHIGDLPDFSLVEPNSRIVYEITSNLDEKQDVNITYLASLGMVTINQFQGIDPYNAIKQQYDYMFHDKSDAEVQQIVKEKSPSLSKMADIYIKNELRIVKLTPVGILIALINLKRVFRKIDYNLWIK